MARLVPGNGTTLVHSIVSDVTSHKHAHVLTLGLESSAPDGLNEQLNVICFYSKICDVGCDGAPADPLLYAEETV